MPTPEPPSEQEPSPDSNPKPDKAFMPASGSDPEDGGSLAKSDEAAKATGRKMPFNISQGRAKLIAVLLLAAAAILGLFQTCSGPIMGSKPYLIGRDDSWYQSRLMGKEQNMDGFTDVLVSAISMVEDTPMTVTSVGSSQLIPYLQNGYVNGILTSLSPSGTNNDLYLFSESFYLYGPVLVVPIRSPVTSIEQMKGRIIGISPGSYTSLPNVSKYTSIVLRDYDNMTQAFTDMLNNKIDGVILGALPASSYVNNLYAGQVRIATPPLNSQGLRLAALNNEKNKVLIERFNAGLEKLKKNGEYDRFLGEWDLVDTEKMVTPPLSGKPH